ncbi:MAG: type II toxin-antitoxin system RelE/ParE family toxin [Nitriliruptorales bacterium]|nr:type II toxin-antitoxin system RelE/ParE family toxin [Nitriliruptorales bacterium]
MARVVVARAAREALEELDYLRAEAVVDALGELERDPRAGYQLRGRLRGLWSYRVGVYRIIYELREEDQTVRVVAIRHRATTYGADPR